MHCLHKGFDALDLAFPLTISDELSEEINNVKAHLNANQLDLGFIDFERLHFTIFPTGARGGFAYHCRFDATQNHWFLKKPGNTGDKWGSRVSCAAMNLALGGIEGARRQLVEELDFLKLAHEPGTESVGRVDFAMDFLAPDFDLRPDHFIMHSRHGWSQHTAAGNMAIHGRAGRTTSVTIGKNPNRQVIVYDKREEVLGKPSHMPPIWDANLERLGLPPLDLSNRSTSTVWRVEIRFFKEYLKNKAGVRTFADLAAAMPDMLRNTVEQIRYVVPNGDSNRARWADHPLWERVRAEIECDFSTIRSNADRATVERFVLAEKDQYLARQIAGCLLNRAALRGVDLDGLKAFTLGQAQQIVENFEAMRDETKDKLDKAKVRYGRLATGKPAA